MGKSSDQLREEIDAKRDETGAKIDGLQQQVHDQIDNTREQVTDAATQVRDDAQAMVTDTVDSLTSSMQDFDVDRHVQERPLVSVGAAVLGGFVLGAMLGGGNNRQGHAANYSSGATSSAGDSHMSGIATSLRTAAQKSGLEETISNAGAAMIGSVTDQLKDMVDRSFPGFSEKLDDAQHRPGSFTDKAKAAQQEAQRQ